MKKRTPKLVESLALTQESTARYPWKFVDGSVQSAKIEKVLEFVPGKDRPKFFNELYRILAAGGTAQIKVPYWSCAAGVQDYAYEWPPWNDNSFLYFNKECRAKLGIMRPELTCDFDYAGGYEIEVGTAQRAAEAQQFAAKHYTNSILAVQLTLTKRAPERH